MTSGVPLYLVSACGTAEEFVAAFRRYADRTGLFIPSALPLPAGRRGRLAVTLKDGGVMIEGEAEILQSSAKPTVLHGRPGMTVKFIEPDELSKVVIGELEKARLAMKPAPPSVPPRPATIPAEPRPVVPPVSGRIDAANALAECVVIGDPSVLKDTASMPKGISDPGSAGNKAKFVVPSIPVAPGRPKTPSIPPSIPAIGPPAAPAAPSSTAAPAAPAAPAPAAAAKAAPAATPVAANKETSGPVGKTAHPKMTSIGFPAIDKIPAKVESGKFISNATTLGMPALAREPSPPVATPDPLLQTQHGVSGAAMRGPAPAAVAAKSSRAIETDDESTTIGEAPPKKITDPMPTTAPAKTTEMSASAPVAAPAEPKPDPAGPRAHAKSHKATSIGFPAVRSPFETQPVGVVPPPHQHKEGDPAPPIVAKSKAGIPGPRGKNPTTPPLTPRHPTPVAPLPIVRPPAKMAVDDQEEKTDLGGVPQPADPHASTVESGRAYRDSAADSPVDPHENTAIAPPATGRSGGMRASEIMAAIPTEDWTMTPEASGPTVLPPTQLPVPVVVSEPTPAPGSAPKGPPTGDWTIQLDPEAGWTPPAKVEKPVAADETKPAKRPKTPPAGAAHAQAKSGNPDIAVSSKEAFTAVEWEDKPTGIGEAKIEIDSTLMEPLKPMPAFDDEDPAALMQPLGKIGGSTGPQPSMPGAGSTGPQPVAAGASYSTGPHQSAPMRAEVIPPPLAPMPPQGPSSGFQAAALMNPTSPSMHAANAPDSYGGFGQMGFPQAPAVAAVPGRNKQRLMIVSAAAVVAIIGVVLVLLLTGGHKNKKSAAGGDSGSALVKHGSQVPVPVPTPGSGAAEHGGSNDEVAVGSGSAEHAVVAPVVVDAGVATQEAPPTPSGTCQVEITSVPSGADIIVDKNKLGVTPGTFDLPCGVEETVTLHKTKFLNTARTVKPVADKPNKLAVKLGKMMFSLKVTSTPAGATITAGGKSAGVTPATIKVPGFEPVAIMLTKPGFAADTQKVSVKANGQAHHVVLKKGGRH